MKQAIVWSKAGCVNCDRARTLLITKGYTVEERKLDEGYTKQQLLEEIPGARAVPQVIIDGKFIGGFSQIVDYLDQPRML